MTFQTRALRILFTLLFVFGAAIAVGDEGKEKGGHGSDGSSPAQGRTEASEGAIADFAKKFLRQYFPISDLQADSFGTSAAKSLADSGTVLGELMGSIKYGMKTALKKEIEDKLMNEFESSKPISEFLKSVKWAIDLDACEEMKPVAGEVKVWTRNACKPPDIADEELKKMFDAFSPKYLDAREQKEVKTVAYQAANEIGRANDKDAAEAARLKWLNIVNQTEKKPAVGQAEKGWEVNDATAKVQKDALKTALESMKDKTGSAADLRKANDELLKGQGFKPENLKEYASFYGGRFAASPTDEDKKLRGDAYATLREGDAFKNGNPFGVEVADTLDRMATRDDNGRLWLNLQEDGKPVSIFAGKDSDWWSSRKDIMNPMAESFFGRDGNTPLDKKYALPASPSSQPPAKENMRRVDDDKKIVPATEQQQTAWSEAAKAPTNEKDQKTPAPAFQANEIAALKSAAVKKGSCLKCHTAEGNGVLSWDKGKFAVAGTDSTPEAAFEVAKSNPKMRSALLGEGLSAEEKSAIAKWLGAERIKSLSEIK